MERKEQALIKALTSLESLEVSIAGNTIDPSPILSSKLNDFIAALGTVFEEGRNMNESSLFPVPLALFDHVSQLEGNNPDIYQMKLLEEVDNTSRKLKAKLEYLQEIGDGVEVGINAPPDLPLPPPPSP
eukprot:gene9701-10728_t